MTSVKRMDSASTTQTPQVTSPGLPRRTPGAAFADTVLGPRPAPPKQRLHAEMHPKLRDLDWNGHVPSAPVRTVADWGSDDDGPIVPRIPGPRQPSDRYTPEQASLVHAAAAIDDLWGTPWAHRAFRSAA